MDGSNALEIYGQPGWRTGIPIDFGSIRLLWVDYERSPVQSSTVYGTGVQLVVGRGVRYSPLGIAVTDDRIFWGDTTTKSLCSSRKDGLGVRTLHNSTHHYMLHLAIATPNPLQIHSDSIILVGVPHQGQRGTEDKR